MVVLIVKQQLNNKENIKRLLISSNVKYKMVNLEDSLDDFEGCVSIDGKTYNIEDLFGDGIIIRNAVKCETCGQEIESHCTSHSIWCKCGKCFIDGGRDYLDRAKIQGPYKEMAVFAYSQGKGYTKEYMLSKFTR